MSEAPAPYTTSLAETLVDRRIAQYQELGFSRERMLQQMLVARLSLDTLRTRFPEFPDTVFVHPPLPKTAAPVETPHTALKASATPPATLTRVSTFIAKPPQAPSRQSPAPVDGISFQYVPLIQCSFPHADPKNASTFSRKNGWLELTLGTMRTDVGLPYGVPARLLTIYCTSEAVRTHSPEIYLGDSLHDFLRRLDVPITRGERGSISVYANQILRLIHSTVSIDENIRDGVGRSGLHIRQALFVEEARLWWDEKQTGQGALGNGSSLMLSSVLFNSILERSAPLSTLAIKKLRKSPMDLDVYAWLVHRLFHLHRPSMVSWSQLSEQFGHNYSLQRKFRQFFLDSLKRVSAVYPEAKLKVSEAGVLLLPSRPHLAKASPKR